MASKNTVYLIDAPSPFAPRLVWEAHLRDLLAASKQGSSPELKAAIETAQNVLAKPATEAEMEAEDAAMRTLFGGAHDGGLAERMDVTEEGAFQPLVMAPKKRARKAV